VPQPPEGRSRSRARSLAFAVAGPLIALTLLEGALRLVAPAAAPLSSPFVIETEVRGDDWRGHHLFGTDDFIADPVTLDDPSASCLWLPRPDRPPFNAEGAIGPLTASPRRAGTLRILAVGDSNTLADGRTGWVQQVSRLVPAATPGGCERGETLNAGVHGYTSYQGRLRLQRFLVARPQVVLIAFGWNDPLPVNAPPDAEYGEHLAATLRQRTPSWWQTLALTGVLRRLLAPGRARLEWPEGPRVSRDAFVANHRAMIEASRSAGALPVLATRPFVLDERHEHLAVDVGHERQVAAYADTLRDLAAAEGVPLLDLALVASAFDRRADWQDTNHFTQAGHRKAAEMAVGVLGERGEGYCGGP